MNQGKTRAQGDYGFDSPEGGHHLLAAAERLQRLADLCFGALTAPADTGAVVLIAQLGTARPSGDMAVENRLGRLGPTFDAEPNPLERTGPTSLIPRLTLLKVTNQYKIMSGTDGTLWYCRKGSFPCQAMANTLWPCAVLRMAKAPSSTLPPPTFIGLPGFEVRSKYFPLTYHFGGLTLTVVNY